MPVEKPVAAADSAKPKSALALPNVVSYIGMSDWRLIRVEDWDVIDVKGEERLWSSHNGWQIPIDKFSDNEMAWIVEQEEFVVKPATMPNLKSAPPVGELNVP